MVFNIVKIRYRLHGNKTPARTAQEFREVSYGGLAARLKVGILPN